MFNLKPFYTFTVTGEPDEDYRKYLTRRIGESAPVLAEPHPADATPLDISMDDAEGDVVAGIAAQTYRDCLFIDLLWVGKTLRNRGVGRRLVAMAEEVALKRGCKNARISATHNVEFYLRLGYAITGKLQQFPEGGTRYYLSKALAPAVMDIAVEHAPA